MTAGIEMNRRRTVIFSLLLGVWVVIFLWQRAEHQGLKERLRTSLYERAKVMSASMDIMLRAMRQFGGAIHDARLQIYLDELVLSKELLGVALVNGGLVVIAQSGETEDLDLAVLKAEGQSWKGDRVSFLHFVDLGTSTFGETPRPREAYLLPPPSSLLPPEEALSNSVSVLNRTRGDFARDMESLGRTNGARAGDPGGTNLTSTGTASGERRSRRWPWPWRGGPMTEEQRSKFGVHGAIFQLSTESIVAAINQDWWQRAIIVVFGFLAAVAAGGAWVNAYRSEDIRMRLLRSKQQNLHLSQMNMAAAGLAHETRNPLNLIRGMAQMITREDAASESVRTRCADMIAEVDRVTGQLNEFINFSKPQAPAPSSVRIASVIEDVLRPLSGELEDFGVKVVHELGALSVEADEKMLRQIIFNLLINSVQAMKNGGLITIRAITEGGFVTLEVADQGSGVSPENREKIFEPYFTTREKEGTGLGLAIVKQIVLAHGWDIEFRPNRPAGAIFAVRQMRWVSPGAEN